MHGISVTLPGGLPTKECIERNAKFHPLTGRMEQALFDSGFKSGIRLERPGYVTAVLSSTLESIGNQSVNDSLVSKLCVADRQYLMLRLAALFSGEQMWLKASCGFCDEPFDVNIDRCDLPIKQAGLDYPMVTLRLGEWTIEVRVPTGADQDMICELSDLQAMEQLLYRCILSVNGEPVSREFINNLSESDLKEIDEALDEASPAICNQLLVNCPECGQEQHADLDHYVLTGMDELFFYDEVHTLASHYHWSEDAILDLPQDRRHLYLDLINRSAGQQPA